MNYYLALASITKDDPGLVTLCFCLLSVRIPACVMEPDYFHGCSPTCLAPVLNHWYSKSVRFSLPALSPLLGMFL